MKTLPILALASCVALATLLYARADDDKNKPKAKPAKSMQLPRVESADLNGKTFVLPDDFSAKRTLLLIAFEREHQELIDGWVEGLQLKPTDNDWFELPTVGAMSPTRQKFLDNAMRGGIRGEAMRSRVITLYIDRQKFIAPLGMTATDTIYVAVATPDGKVLALQQGAFDKSKAKVIGKVWRAK